MLDKLWLKSTNTKTRTTTSVCMFYVTQYFFSEKASLSFICAAKFPWDLLNEVRDYVLFFFIPGA